jgi:putative heme degradation protein
MNTIPPNSRVNRIRAAVEKGPPENDSTAGEFFNVQTDTLDLHIRWQQLAAAFAVEKPSHMDGTATRSLQFFEQTGFAAFKVFLNFGGPIPPEREAKFVDLRSKFGR